MLTTDVRAKVEENSNLQDPMQNKCNEQRQRAIGEGLRDEIKLRQPPFAPDLHVGTKMQCAFGHTDGEGKDEIIEWCTGTVTKVSNESNL